MKSFALNLLAFVFVLSSAHAQTPQKIYGIAKERKSLGYYSEQAALWKNVAERESWNSDAWINYYLASRAELQLGDPKLWSDGKEKFYARLDHIIDEVAEVQGKLFAFYYINGMNSMPEEALPHFERAYELAPDRSETYGWLFTYYATQELDERARDVSRKMRASNTYSNANLQWNRNALSSLEENAVLITLGDMDCLPKWTLQYADDFRTDVLVISAPVFANDSIYRNRILKALNLQSAPKPQLGKSFQEDMYAWITMLLKNTTRTSYLSSGAPIQLLEATGLNKNLYVIGNVLQYSQQHLDNTKLLIDNIFDVYNWCYLDSDFQFHHDQEVVSEQLNLAYLPGLYHLKKYYSDKSSNPRSVQVNELIELIIAQSGRPKQVRGWFE